MKRSYFYIAIAAFVTVLALSVAESGAAPRGTDAGVSPECAHIVQRGETLGVIGAKHGEPWQTLAKQSPWITNPNNIWPGDVVNVCSNIVEAPSVPNIVEPSSIATSPRMVGLCSSVDDEVNRRALASALISAKPDHLGKSDVVNLVSAAGVESLFGCDIWNPHDASGSYTGSIGILQTRVLYEGHRAARPGRFDDFRQASFLLGPECSINDAMKKPAPCLGDLDAQAIAAWRVYTTFGFNEGSWGAVPHITASDRQLAQASVDAVWNTSGLDVAIRERQ